jgi:hypothetical protein
LKKVPDLMVLELNNNPWSCNCDIAEVIQWAELRREQQPAHKTVKCLEGQQYRILWTMAGGTRSCIESKTTEPVVPHEFTTDMTVDLTIMSVNNAPPLKASPGTTLQRLIENAVTSEDELRTTPKNETVAWASLLFWNNSTLTVFLIPSIIFGVAVFVSLKAVNYIVKRGKEHRTQHDKQEKYNHNAASFSEEPLLEPQITANITKQQAGFENEDSDTVGGTEYYVCERIEKWPHVMCVPLTHFQLNC